MKTDKKKSIRFLGLLLLPLAAFLMGGTYAYFTDEAVAINRLQTGDVEAELEEPEWDRNRGRDGEDMEPGDTVIKDPLITAAVGDMYFRLVMTVHDIDNNGQPGSPISDEERLYYILQTLYQDTGYPDAANLDTALSYHSNDLERFINEGKIYNVSQLKDFTLNRRESGGGIYYYYYNDIFRAADEAAGRAADNLYFMTHIVVPQEWGEEEIDLLGSYGITFQVQAIQADAFSSKEEAFAALPDALAENETGNQK